MKSNRKSSGKLYLLSKIWGIIFTTFIFLTIGMKIIFGFFGDEPGTAKIRWQTFATWDDPVPYFLVYMFGYLMVWWKPLTGSIILMAASIYYVVIQGFDGPPILALPGFIVGALYFSYWYVDVRKKPMPDRKK